MPQLLSELNSGGIPDEHIVIIVALGMHRKQTLEELESLVGARIMQRVKVQNHSALPEDCTLLGTSSLGTPIEINRTAAEAELLIACGNIEPHALVGMSGGIKALIPGVASQRCIEANHSLSQQYKAVPGQISNQVHQDLEEALRFIRIHYILNVVVNHRREIIAASAGDVIAAHRAGIQLARERFVVPVSSKYDFVIASAGGHPKDMQLYQAIKTIVNASKIALPGAPILIAARCEEQFGNGIFQYWTETIQDQERIVQMLKEKFVLGAHKIAHLHEVLMEHPVYLISELPEAAAQLLGLKTVSPQNMQHTIEELLPERDGSIAFLPYGSLTFPELLES